MTEKSFTVMNWYSIFNLSEAVIWWIVAIAICLITPSHSRRQRWGVVLAAVSFFVFGVTDVCEASRERWIPLWLWGLKCLCGVGILLSRYLWLGWSRFHWTDREFLFGLGCLIAVAILISLQFRLIV